MSGNNRSFKRGLLRERYRQFGEVWHSEQRYQQILLAGGGTLPAGTNKLTRKPTFAMWMQAVADKQLEYAARAAAEPVKDKKQVEVTDTEW